jgi:Phage DNA packaging protein Nu1
MATPKAVTITIEELAETFSVVSDTVRAWRMDGMPSRVISGRPRFVLRECIRWRREKDREAGAAAGDGPDEKEQRVRKLKAEADLKEMELAERRGQVIATSVMEETLERLVGGFAAVAMGRLTPFERKIVSCGSAGGAREITDQIKIQLMIGCREYADVWQAEADELDKAEVVAAQPEAAG